MNKQIHYQQLLNELTHLYEDGILLYLNNQKASPEEVAQAHLVCEAPTYMRDYILSEDFRRIEEVHFDFIKEEERN